MSREIQKVLVIGRGAVGLTLGSTLEAGLAAEDFAFLVDPARRQRYEQEELIINGKVHPVRLVSRPEEFGKADLILFMTKYGGLASAMETAAPFIQDSTILMAGTNGVISEDDLSARFPENTVLRTITQKMDALFQDNALTFSRQGEIVFGAEKPEQQEAVQQIQALFEKTGMPYVIPEDIVVEQYSKLMANCGLNQICAAYGQTYGTITHDPVYAEMFKAVMEEVRQIVKTRGIEIPEEKVQEWIDATAALAEDSMPSMAQDVLAKRQTELPLFAGTILQFAKEAGLQAPLNEDLHRRIEKIDAQNMRETHD